MFVNSKSSILNIIYQTIKLEADTLSRLLGLSFDSLMEVVESISISTGRVIVTGVGKSGLAARKISSTLNSTGTASIYLHGGDALHGDLGAIQQDDIVIVISKSGNSNEIVQMLPQLKDRCALIVAFVSKEDSKLAEFADTTVYIPVKEEADPNGLAPTSSTIAHIAVGDAMALALQYKNGWTEKSFASVHPGGALGKRLSLLISDLNPQSKRPIVQPSTSIKGTILEISSNRMGVVAVCNGDDLKGIITDGDLRRMLEKHDDWSQLIASDIMSTSPKTICSDILAYDALRIMEHHNITQLLVVDDDKYIGVVHLHDLLSEGL